MISEAHTRWLQFRRGAVLRTRPALLARTALVQAVLGCVGVLLLTAGAPAPEPAPVTSPAVLLRLEPLSGTPLSLTAADLEKLPRHTVHATYHSGAEHQLVQADLSGFALRDVLRLLAMPEGEALHGDALRLYVVAEGADGYRVLLAVAELDASFTDSPILIADRRDGKPFSATEGPLRLVVMADKRPARWVRQLVRLSVRQAS